MLKRWTFFMMLMVVALAAGATAQSDSDTVTLVLMDGVDEYDGTKDNTIFSERANSNGSGQHIFVGDTNRGAERRTLIAFDLSMIPAGSTILSVELELTVSKTRAGNTVVRAQRLTKDWGEGSEDAGGQEGRGIAASDDTATWRSNFHNTSEWDNAGGDVESATSASGNAAGTNSKLRLSGDGMVADVQAWLDGEAENFGWRLAGNGTAKRFHSSEGNAERRPTLTIEYESGEGAEEETDEESE